MVLSYVFQVGASRDSLEKIPFFSNEIFFPGVSARNLFYFCFFHGFLLFMALVSHLLWCRCAGKDVFRWICSEDFLRQECRLDLPPRCFLDADSEAQGKMPPKSLNFHACWIELG